MKSPLILGAIEAINLPEFGVAGVTAKIDTGADGSAIWASDIREKNGELFFVLFGPSSPHYTGQTLSTHNYRVASIKNSFGHSEFRYKVPLKICIGGRNIRVHFTLADRSNNRLSVLIGSRTLRGKFVVDVSKAKNKKELQVLLLTTARSLSAKKEFIRAIEATNQRLRITLASFEELEFTLGVPANSVILRDLGKDIASFDFVYFKNTAAYFDIAASAAQYLEKRGIPFVDKAVAASPISSKLYQYVILADNNIAVPKSVFMLPSKLPESYDHIKITLGLPFVLKDINGSNGHDNFLVKNEKDFIKACKQAAKNKLMLVAQQFVANDGDYRILLLGYKIVLSFYRNRLPGSMTHMNNTSQGAKAKLIYESDIPTKVQKDSMIAAKLLQREVAGVDMVQDKTDGSWYCLEVNSDPQLVTGVFLKEKQTAFAKFVQDELTKEGL